MSASLVGSEMCIRDRAGRGRPRQGAVLPGWHSRCAWRSRPVLRTVDREAVSYTHLTLPTICSV
eukprot:3797537-Alexandrium_andersonii.AAC.1